MIICTSFIIAKETFFELGKQSMILKYPFEPKFLYGYFKTGNNHLHSIIVKLPQFIGRTSFRSKVGCNSLIIILSSLPERINYISKWIRKCAKLQEPRLLYFTSSTVLPVITILVMILSEVLFGPFLLHLYLFKTVSPIPPRDSRKKLNLHIHHSSPLDLFCL